MTCRDCDKVSIGGLCSVDGHLIKDFDEKCKFTEEEIVEYERTKTCCTN